MSTRDRLRRGEPRPTRCLFRVCAAIADRCARWAGFTPPFGRPIGNGGVNPALLAKVTLRHIARPFRFDAAIPDIAVDRGIGPVHRPPNKTVLHRIAPAISDVGRQIGLIADVVLPEPWLPHPDLSLAP